MPAVPGKIVELVDETPATRTGRVQFGGIVKDINLAFVPDAGIGDYVLAHVGFAITRIDAEAAARTLAELGITSEDS